jgi:hypothetical protein
VILFPTVSVNTKKKQTGKIDFTLTDIGFVSTDELDVTLTLPSGSQASGGSAGQQISGGNGWACVITGGGVTCQHDAIKAFGQAKGEIDFSITDSAACGQNVRMAASSSADSVSASSSISC